VAENGAAADHGPLPFAWRSLGRAALVLGVLAVALCFANRAWGFWERRNGDLPVYLRAAERMQEGDEIYRPEDRRPFTYPPFLALAPAALAALPAWAHRPVWYCLNALVLVTIVLLVQRHTGRRRRDHRRTGRPWVFWTLMALLAGRHVSSAFENQSNDLWIALAVLLCADAGARGRQAASGAWAGLGAAVKATPLLFAPAFLVQKRWTAMLLVVASAGALTLLPDVVAPREDGRSWAVAWYDAFLAGNVAPGATAGRVGNAWDETNILNQNLAGTLTRLSTPVQGDGNMRIDASVWAPSQTTLRVVILLAQLGVLALLAFGLRPGARESSAWRRFGEAGAVACGMVLLSPMSSKSHFCVLVVPFAFLLVDWLRGRDRVTGLVLLGAALTGTFTTKGLWGRSLGNEILARGPVTWCAFLTLLGAVHVLRRRTSGIAGGA